MSKTIIGVDAFPLCRVNGGIGFYIFHLLDELIIQKKDCLFYLYAPSDKGDIEYFKKFENVRIRTVPKRSLGHSLWSLSMLALFAWKDKVDVFWGTTQSFPLLKRKKMRTMLTLYDFVYLLYPETVSTYKCIYLKVFSRWFFKNASVIVPISYATGQRLAEIYGLSFHCVVHPPIKPEISFKDEGQAAPFISKHNLKYNGYIVTVGTLEPRKNFAVLVQKYIQILESSSLEEVLPLVIIGGGGWKNEEICKVLFEAQEKYPNHVKLLGFIADKELPYYLSAARYYITLSLYEGYGMPLAEARVCRTPVACFDQPEMREASEDDGIFFTTETLDKGLRDLVTSKESEKIEKSSLKVSYSSNAESAAKLADIISLLECKK